MRSFEGNLDAAAAAVKEADAIADATGTGRVSIGRLILAGFGGEQPFVSEHVEADHPALASRPGRPAGNYALMNQQAVLRWGNSSPFTIWPQHCRVSCRGKHAATCLSRSASSGDLASSATVAAAADWRLTAA